MAEKLRSLLERGKARDYYDVWKLLEVRTFDGREVRRVLQRKCEGRGVHFEEVGQLFPRGIASTLRPHLKAGLTRLSSEPLPSPEDLLMETKANLRRLLE